MSKQNSWFPFFPHCSSPSLPNLCMRPHCLSSCLILVSHTPSVSQVGFAFIIYPKSNHQFLPTHCCNSTLSHYWVFQLDCCFLTSLLAFALAPHPFISLTAVTCLLESTDQITVIHLLTTNGSLSHSTKSTPLGMAYEVLSMSRLSPAFVHIA